jgi:hypothetical protein
MRIKKAQKGWIRKGSRSGKILLLARRWHDYDNAKSDGSVKVNKHDIIAYDNLP